MSTEVNASKDVLGTGRRKTSVARVRVRNGSGKILINQRPLENFFVLLKDREKVLSALKETSLLDKVDVVAKVHGGGPTGQAGAVLLGLARALKARDEDVLPILREKDLLTRDSRMKERKKYGLRGARRGTQFSKR